jgi:hypothetical protein
LEVATGPRDPGEVVVVIFRVDGEQVVEEIR